MREFDMQADWVLGLIDFFKYEVLSPLSDGIGDELIASFDGGFTYDMNHLSVVEDWYKNVLTEQDAMFVSTYFATYKLQGKNNIYSYHKAIGLLYYFLRVIPYTALVCINDTLLLGKDVADRIVESKQNVREVAKKRFEGKRVFAALDYPLESEYLDVDNEIRAILLLNGLETVADVLYFERDELQSFVGEKGATIYDVLIAEYGQNGEWV